MNNLYKLIESTGTELTGVLRHGAPVPRAVLLDVGDEDDVLLRRPWPLLHAGATIVAAWWPPHVGPEARKYIYGYLKEHSGT